MRWSAPLVYSGKGLPARCGDRDLQAVGERPAVLGADRALRRAVRGDREHDGYRSVAVRPYVDLPADVALRGQPPPVSEDRQEGQVHAAAILCSVLGLLAPFRAAQGPPPVALTAARASAVRGFACRWAFPLDLTCSSTAARPKGRCRLSFRYSVTHPAISAANVRSSTGVFCQ